MGIYFTLLLTNIFSCLSSEGDADRKFSVDPKTGKIYAKSLDREDQERYTLTVEARDNGVPPRRNDTTVIITVSHLYQCQSLLSV